MTSSILDEGDDFHPPLSLRACQGVDLIDLLDQPGPGAVFSYFFL